MSFGFQLAVRTAPDERIFTDDGHPAELALPDPVGKVSLFVDQRGRRQELLIRKLGLATADEAARIGRRLKDQVRLASAMSLLGIDVGDDKATGAVGPGFIEQHPELTECQVLPDVHGLVVFEETGRTVRRPIVDVALVVTRSEERFMAELAASAQAPPLSPGVATACDLLSTAEYHPRLEHRLVAMVSAAEVLVDPPVRSGGAAQVVDQLIDVVKTALVTKGDEDEPSLRSLLRAVQNLKREGVSATCRSLARAARPDSERDADSIMRRAITARGAFLHAAEADVDSDLLTALRDLIGDMILTRIAVERLLQLLSSRT